MDAQTAAGSRRRRVAAGGAGVERVERSGLLGSLSNHRRAAAVTIAIFVLLGTLAAFTRSPAYEATAKLIVEDVRADNEFDVTTAGERSNAVQESERYLSDQVEIMKSARVARMASERLAEQGVERSPESLLQHRSVSGDATSNLIIVAVEGSAPEVAKLSADALAEAYVRLRREQVQNRADRAREEVKALQAALRQDLDAIEERIGQLRADDTQRRTLQAQFDDALDTLNSLRERRAELPVGAAQRNAINDEIAELRRDFEAWQVILDIEQQSTELSALLAERDQVIAEISALAARGNSIAVDAELDLGGVVLSDPADLPEEPVGVSPLLIIAAAFALGVGVAAALSYYLDTKESVVTSSSAPATILDAPPLAEVPAFRHEDIDSDIPVLTSPTSAAAEAFRFAAAALEIRASTVRARSVFITSASVGAGKSVATANTGIAAASDGLDILLVDADLASQRLTSLLGVKTTAGLTDVAAGDVHLDDAIKKMRLSDERYVSLLSRGSQAVEGPTFIRSERVRELFKELVSRFTLVLIDGPPLLQVAYASTLATTADSAIVVVEHASSQRQLDVVAARLQVVETPILGYLYSKAPPSRDMVSADGSPPRARGFTNRQEVGLRQG